MKTNKKTTPSSYAVHIISIPEGGAMKDNATGEMEKGNTTVFYFFYYDAAVRALDKYSHTIKTRQLSLYLVAVC